MSRKRSVVWDFFKSVDSAADQCLLCTFQSKQGHGSTSSMLKHLRVKHPEEVAQRYRGRSSESIPRNCHQDVDTDSDHFCSVEVSLEDGVSDINTTMNKSDISSAIEGILVAADGGSAEHTSHREVKDDHPVRRSRHKRSLIWRHYERLDSLNAARCCICKKKLKCFEGGGTSNLHRHMSKRHPEVLTGLLANGHNPLPSHSPQGSKANRETSAPPDAVGGTEQRRFSGSKAFKGDKQVFKRERDLIEALRKTQKEETRALELQRQLMEKLRVADAREAAAEREKIESLRKVQQEEAEELSRQREELQKEKAELQKKWEVLRQEREDLLLFSKGQ